MREGEGWVGAKKNASQGAAEALIEGVTVGQSSCRSSV